MSQFSDQVDGQPEDVPNGRVGAGSSGAGSSGSASVSEGSECPATGAGDGEPSGQSATGSTGADPVRAAALAEVQELLDERTADLQRLQAEYANYKKRVDRDKALVRQSGVESVVVGLLPVLDSVAAAREHEELTGGFKLVADELVKLGAKYGLEFYGEVGEVFDPNVHEALMQQPHIEPVSEPTVSAVMQQGVRLGGRVVRPARVSVANPDE